MSEYQALYRAWRPEKFKDIYGQEPITQTLKNQIVSKRVGHAYLFCGSRGTGKTTTAKVLARAVNCTDTKDGEPCGECAVCRQMKNESSLDVFEFDAASNSRVEQMRDLMENIPYLPTVGKYKVYIIDEVHMLSNSAFNALLKTLEEPPAHIIFILATTEPQKLPATILSRCQRYDFKRISVKNICARLKVVLEGIGRECTPEAVEEIAVAADGGMRDALSLMDICLSYTDGTVDAELVRQVLGSTGRGFMFEFADALEAGDAAKALSMIDKAMTDGRDPSVFSREVAAHLRTILIAQMTGEKVSEIAEITGEDAKRFIEQGKRFESTRLMRAMDAFIKAEGEMRYVAMPRSIIELCAVRACRVSNEKEGEGLRERVEALEKQMREGVLVQRQSAPGEALRESGKEAEAPKPKPRPVRISEDDKENAKLFEQALEIFGENVESTKYFAKNLRFVSIKDNIVYALWPEKNTLEFITKKQREIDAALTEAFGKEVKLLINVESPGENIGGIGSDLSTKMSDVFPRDKTEYIP